MAKVRVLRDVRLRYRSRLSGPGTEFERVAALDRDGRRLIEAAVEKLGLSARAFVKVLRVARTVADLEGEPKVRAPHVAEAIQGRLLDREVVR